MSKIQSQLLHTGFHGMRAEWSNSGELLAVAGRVNIIIDRITLAEYDGIMGSRYMWNMMMVAKEENEANELF